MDRTEQIVFDTLELEYTLTQLLKKRQTLYLKGCNDEKLNDKIRDIQQKLRVAQ
jgi:fatty acid-binding protein DegV